MRFWLVVFALLAAPAVAMASETGRGQDAGRVQLSTPRVFEIPLTTKDGYTSTLTVRVFNQRVADQLQRYLDKQPLNDDVQNYGTGGGEWTDYAMMNAVTAFINFSCAFFGGAVIYTGAVNIFIDGVGALCASFSLVTEIEAAGKAMYEAYMKSALDHHATYNFALIGECGFGPIC